MTSQARLPNEAVSPPLACLDSTTLFRSAMYTDHAAELFPARLFQERQTTGRPC